MRPSLATNRIGLLSWLNISFALNHWWTFRWIIISAIDLFTLEQQYFLWITTAPLCVYGLTIFGVVHTRGCYTQEAPVIQSVTAGWIITTPCQHSPIAKTIAKQRPFAFILFDFKHWGSRLRLHQCYFSAINTCITHGITNLFHILTSFMHVGPISMLTNRSRHGTWNVNESRKFRNVSYPAKTTFNPWFCLRYAL